MWESRIVASIWVALAGGRGATWILLGLVLSHPFHAIWLPAEHRGLPHDGTIFARTRTMRPSRFVQWWLWNMNFHAEHHAWPAISWHQLPTAHRHLSSYVEQRSTRYLRLHADAFRKRVAS